MKIEVLSGDELIEWIRQGPRTLLVGRPGTGYSYIHERSGDECDLALSIPPLNIARHYPRVAFMRLRVADDTEKDVIAHLTERAISWDQLRTLATGAAITVSQ